MAVSRSCVHEAMFWSLAELKGLSLSTDWRMLVSPSLFIVSLEFSFSHFFAHITSPVRTTEIVSRFGSFTYRIMGAGMPRPPGTAVFPPVCQQAAVWAGAPLGEPSPRSVHTRASGILQCAEPPLQTYSDTRRSCVCLTPPLNTHAAMHACGQGKHTFTGFSTTQEAFVPPDLHILSLSGSVFVVISIRTSVLNHPIFLIHTTSPGLAFVDFNLLIISNNTVSPGWCQWKRGVKIGMGNVEQCFVMKGEVLLYLLSQSVWSLVINNRNKYLTKYFKIQVYFN